MRYVALVLLVVASGAAAQSAPPGDRVMQLLGLHWAHATISNRAARIAQLESLQRTDGGWGQTPYLRSDAYATGQVLYTLRQVGVSASDPALQRGVAFLVASQAQDGSWHVINRAMKLQPYWIDSIRSSATRFQCFCSSDTVTRL